MVNYYNKRIQVRSHTRFDPRIKRRVNVHTYKRNQKYISHPKIQQIQQPEKIMTLDINSNYENNIEVIMKNIEKRAKREMDDEDYKDFKESLEKWIPNPPEFFPAPGTVQNMIEEIHDYLDAEEYIPIYRELTVTDRQFREIKEGKEDPGSYWALFPEGTGIYHKVKDERKAVCIEIIPTKEIDREGTYYQIAKNPDEWEVLFKNKRNTIKRNIYWLKDYDAFYFYNKAEKLIT